MHHLALQGPDLLGRAFDLWEDGGWAMGAIALAGLVSFTLGLSVWARLRGTGFRRVPEKTWRKWLDHPEQRRGRIGEALDLVADASSMSDARARFNGLRSTLSAPFVRDLRVMRIAVAASPLLGLLGTVMGMLATFDALSSGSGGDETMTAIAGGISEALITTETGLVIALPGLFFQSYLARQHEALEAFLAHLETVCTQRAYLAQQRRAA